jgi:hypothetical protein
MVAMPLFTENPVMFGTTTALRKTWKLLVTLAVPSFTTVVIMFVVLPCPTVGVQVIMP